MRISTLILAIVLALTANLFADTIIVDPNGSGDYTTVQDGIDYSWDGDTVIVRPATYNEQDHAAAAIAKAGKCPVFAWKGETHSILYTNLSKLISPINLFHHYWGHNPHSHPVNGYTLL